MTESAYNVGRLLIAAATLAYAVGPMITDLNRTHLLHPAWPAHARFHLSWSVGAQLATGAVSLWLVWTGDPDARERTQFAAILGLCYCFGFWTALATKKLYRGALHDRGGIPPIAGRVDGNLLAMIVMTVLLLAGWFLVRG